MTSCDWILLDANDWNNMNATLVAAKGYFYYFEQVQLRNVLFWRPHSITKCIGSEEAPHISFQDNPTVGTCRERRKPFSLKTPVASSFSCSESKSHFILLSFQFLATFRCDYTAQFQRAWPHSCWSLIGHCAGCDCRNLTHFFVRSV